MYLLFLNFIKNFLISLVFLFCINLNAGKKKGSQKQPSTRAQTTTKEEKQQETAPDDDNQQEEEEEPQTSAAAAPLTTEAENDDDGQQQAADSDVTSEPTTPINNNSNNDDQQESTSKEQAVVASTSEPKEDSDANKNDDDGQQQKTSAASTISPAAYSETYARPIDKPIEILMKITERLEEKLKEIRDKKTPEELKDNLLYFALLHDHYKILQLEKKITSNIENLKKENNSLSFKDIKDSKDFSKSVLFNQKKYIKLFSENDALFKSTGLISNISFTTISSTYQEMKPIKFNLDILKILKTELQN